MSTQYRCSLFTMHKTLDEVELTKKHTDLIQRTPFAHLLMAIIRKDLKNKKKHDHNLDAIIAEFKKDRGRFVFGSVECDILRSDVQLIFGIVDGSEQIIETRKARDDIDWAKRVFAKDVMNRDQIRSPLLKTTMQCRRVDGASINRIRSNRSA